MRRPFLFAAPSVLALAALMACSDPAKPSGQAQQGQNGVQTAKVAAPA